MAWRTVGSIQGPEGPRGPAGRDGKGISIAGQVDRYGDLPTDLVADDSGKGYLVTSDGLLYIWTGNAFPPESGGVEFRGEKGEQGERGAKGDVGAAGPRGIQGERGETGPRGIQGTKGDKGDTGERGAKGDKGDAGDKGDQGVQGVRGSLWHVGSGAPTASTVPDGQPGDLYLDQDDEHGTLYFNFAD